jgi:hypothetical protein
MPAPRCCGVGATPSEERRSDNHPPSIRDEPRDSRDQHDSCGGSQLASASSRSKLFFDRDNGVQGLTWALPKPLGQLGSNDALLMKQAAGRVDEFNDWMHRRGAVDVNASFMKLIVTGQREAGVVITNMRAKIDECTSPLTQTLLYGPPEGERENVQIAFNLDEDISIAREVNSKKNFGDPDYLGQSYFKDHTIPLSLGEDQVFSIVATTSSRYCKWYIDMEIFVAGHNEHVRIGYRADRSNDQKPLQVTALTNFQVGHRAALQPTKSYAYWTERLILPVFFPLIHKPISHSQMYASSQGCIAQRDVLDGRAHVAEIVSEEPYYQGSNYRASR